MTNNLMLLTVSGEHTGGAFFVDADLGFINT